MVAARTVEGSQSDPMLDIKPAAGKDVLKEDQRGKRQVTVLGDKGKDKGLHGTLLSMGTTAAPCWLLDGETC